ncbi:hypothetical protein L9F63_005173, partial [Diploptera punctata]
EISCALEMQFGVRLLNHITHHTEIIGYKYIQRMESDLASSSDFELLVPDEDSKVNFSTYFTDRLYDRVQQEPPNRSIEHHLF